MTIHNYNAMVMRLEREARDAPGAYRFKVACLVFLAYAYIGLILAFAIGLLGGTGYGIYWLIAEMQKEHLSSGYSIFRVAIPVVVALVGFVFTVLRALWVTIPEPRGRVLHRGEAMPLFQEIDRLCTALKTQRFDTVIVDANFNAGVIQVPRLGILGWQKNYLKIGIPLLLALPASEFRAVLAHELGHISRDDHQFQHKIYRLFFTWETLLDEFAHERTAAQVLFVPFFSWYVPFFYAYTFALRRADEYAADKAAARAVGAESMADALIRTDLLPYRMEASRKNEPMDARAQQAWLNDALSVPDSLEDEHPCLKNRLRGIGQLNRTPQAKSDESSAADRYLGNRLKEIAASVGIVFRAAPTETEAESGMATVGATAKPSGPTMASVSSTGDSGLKPVGG